MNSKQTISSKKTGAGTVGAKMGETEKQRGIIFRAPTLLGDKAAGNGSVVQELLVWAVPIMHCSQQVRLLGQLALIQLIHEVDQVL